MASNKNRKSRWDEPKENDKSHKEKDDGLSCKSGNDSHCGISNKGNQVILGSKRRLEDNPEQQEKQSGSITIKMNKPQTQGEPLVQKKKVSLAAVFNDESDSEEEMPLECRMKMRNIGRDTITSAGPKSYNKGKKGFTHCSFKQFELSMKPRNSMEKQNDIT